MESYAPNSDDMMNQNSTRVPTGMEQDTRADEEIIDQTDSSPADDTELQPAPIEKPAVGQETPIDDLASSIAYALDGSGRGEIGGDQRSRESTDAEHKVITEGTTGAGLSEEEANLSDR